MEEGKTHMKNICLMPAAPKPKLNPNQKETGDNHQNRQQTTSTATKHEQNGAPRRAFLPVVSPAR
jgi:hypothetical protein